MAVALDRPRPLHAPRRRGIAAWLALAALAAGAATVLYWRKQTRAAERDHPPLGRFLSIDGVRLHYVERGRGEQAIVLLHGNGSMVQDFLASGVVDRLAARHRVMIFDRPGFGHSTRPKGRLWGPAAQAGLLLEAVDRLGLHRPVVVGHSWGTLVALAMGLSRPAALRSLVLISGYYNPTLRLDVPLLAPPGIPVLGAPLRWTISPALGRLIFPLLLRHIFAPGPGARRFARLFPKELALRPGQIRASAAETGLMIPSAIAYRRRHRALLVPTLVVAGSGDRLINTGRQSARFAERLPRASLHLIPGTGHMVHHQAPGRVAALIDLATTVP
jgi:pimeloyl-ACP methyl ester carboxylesterase